MKRLCRSRNKTIGGVCTGLANHLDMDPTIIKVIFILGTVLTVFPFVLSYVVLWIAVPLEEI